MTTKSPLPHPIASARPTQTAEETRLRNMRETRAQEALDKAAADAHPRKGDIDRAGFDLGGVDGEPIDAGLRNVDTPTEK